MQHGFDCFSSISAGMPTQLRALGYTFFARYYRRAPLEGGRGNAMSRMEAQHLFAADFWALAIYQNSSDKPAYFTPENAREDAKAALAAAKHHGQPYDTTIYFAVDCNPAPADLQAIHLYFRIVKDILWEAGYYCGAYGSGLVCRTLVEEGLAHRTWLSNAKGWRGYVDWFPHADVIQTTQPFTLPFGLQIDANSCQDPRYAGMWHPDMAQEKAAPTSQAQKDLLSRISAAISRIFR